MLAIAVLPTYLSLMKGIIRHACSTAWGIWDKDAGGQCVCESAGGRES